jgi:hypothetical protein
MNLVLSIHKNTLSANLSIQLAILNNTSQTSIAYGKAFEVIKPLIIAKLEEDNQDVYGHRIQSELSDILEAYNEYC